MLKSKEENPDGLYAKYTIGRVDGTPINPEDVYFVLKLEGEGDPNHIEACRKAIITYADEIREFNPQLAIELLEKYLVLDQFEDITLERQIGEIFEIKGKKYIVVEGSECEDCIICDSGLDMHAGICSSVMRHDGKDVIFKLLK